VRISSDLFMLLRRPLQRMRHTENMRATNAYEARAHMKSSATGASRL